MKQLGLMSLLVIFLCFGCATATKNSCVWDSWNTGYVCNDRIVEIISDPPGARIEIDDDYIGDAPVSRQWDGCCYSQYSHYVIKAYPLYPGQYVQSKVISMDKLPSKIYFDMNLAPAPKGYNIDIK